MHVRTRVIEWTNGYVLQYESKAVEGGRLCSAQYQLKVGGEHTHERSHVADSKTCR